MRYFQVILIDCLRFDVDALKESCLPLWLPVICPHFPARSWLQALLFAPLPSLSSLVRKLCAVDAAAASNPFVCVSSLTLVLSFAGTALGYYSSGTDPVSASVIRCSLTNPA